ncbi:hypothetical protein MMC21_001573 [Puttea exsequens]|nr:hypothetical protein [Puttea exsequens]
MDPPALSQQYPTPQIHGGHFLQSAPYPPQATLPSQHDIGIDPFAFDPQLENQPEIQHPHQRHNVFDQNPFDRTRQPQPRFQEIRSTASPRQSSGFQPQNGGIYGVLPQERRAGNTPSEVNQGQFGVLSPHPQLPSQKSNHEQLGRLQHELDPRPALATGGGASQCHFDNMKMIPNPPDLDEWRQKLFDVEDVVSMTEEEFQTYFPHVDNIYSHRSTQRYKKKPFVSHYWDCRLKGRPPGTAKSNDPNKKKRKRQARERDLCDVKIKITEYFPGARSIMGTDFPTDAANDNVFAPARAGSAHPEPGSDGARYYTIQKVNGNGANGKGPDGVAGGHRHTLEDSDKLKKSSIHRHFLKEEKEKRKSSKTYHKKATGPALNTVKKHAKEHDLKLYGSCFCPFVQRVWISLEIKGLSYQYIEVDPYKKPDELMRINPRGLIPALQHGDWGCYESSVLMEYLEDLNVGAPLLPQGNPKARAHCRLWSDHINRNILPHFYGLLQAQEQAKQVEQAGKLKEEIKKIVDAADTRGPFFLGPHISFVDIQFAPWMVRMRRVLEPYRGWPEPEPGSRWAAWVNAVEGNEGVKATVSSDELYVDSYERYAGESTRAQEFIRSRS